MTPIPVLYTFQHHRLKYRFEPTLSRLQPDILETWLPETILAIKECETLIDDINGVLQDYNSSVASENDKCSGA